MATTHTRAMRRWFVVIVLLVLTMSTPVWACPFPPDQPARVVKDIPPMPPDGGGTDAPDRGESIAMLDVYPVELLEVEPLVVRDVLLASGEEPLALLDVELVTLRELEHGAARDVERGASRVPAGGLALLTIAGLSLLLMRHFRRVGTLRDSLPVTVSLLVAERLARAAQRRGGVVGAIGIVGVPALVAMDLGLLAIISTVVAAIGVRRFGVARSVLQMVDAARNVTAEAIGHLVVVRSPLQEVHLEVAPGALARELRHAVPTARAVR
jgi:hypothetical protein